jgi:DNA-binding HxlR family transcriptional regulator
VEKVGHQVLINEDLVEEVDKLAAYAEHLEQTLRNLPDASSISRKKSPGKPDYSLIAENKRLCDRLNELQHAKQSKKTKSRRNSAKSDEGLRE